MISARGLCSTMGYSEWRNFDRVVEKAKQLIASGICDGVINDTTLEVSLGSGAIRKVRDYLVDDKGMETILSLCASKLRNDRPQARNETALLALVKKYCAGKGVPFAFQAALEQYVYDACVAGRILIEFDEQHHFTSKSQRSIDVCKEETASRLGYSLLRFKVSHDIIDIILEIDRCLAQEYAIFQNKGYQGLYGGLGVKEIHTRKGLTRNQEILDHMGSTELAANLFRATQTDEKLRRDRVQGKERANHTHYEVGRKVRQTIAELGGTMPEDLPTPNRSAKKIEREQGINQPDKPK